MKDGMNLNFLFGKAQTAERLTPDEIQFAEGLVASPDPDDAIMANGILFMVGHDQQRTAACERLRQICEVPSFYQSGTALGILLLILEYLEKREFQSSPCFTDLVYRAAKHPFLGARINAMRVLRQLAATRDEKAIDLLKESLNDSHEYVTRAARTSLKLAGLEV
jgi:hypothetical protein